MSTWCNWNHLSRSRAWRPVLMASTEVKGPVPVVVAPSGSGPHKTSMSEEDRLAFCLLCSRSLATELICPVAVAVANSFIVPRTRVSKLMRWTRTQQLSRHLTNSAQAWDYWGSWTYGLSIYQSSPCKEKQLSWNCFDHWGQVLQGPNNYGVLSSLVQFCHFKLIY